jgi:hypothetical protein
MALGDSHSDVSKRGGWFTRTVATTKEAPEKGSGTLLGSITGKNTRARTRRGEPTGEIYDGVRRYR